MAESAGRKTRPLKDARTSMQKQAFTLWLNRRLKKFNIAIDDVVKDLADGKALFCLVEDLTKKKLRRQSSFTGSMNRYFQIESVGLALKYLRKEGVSLRNIGPEDIVDGRENLILGLLWTLMSHFEYRALSRSGSSSDGRPKSASFKERMLELVQDKLPGHGLTNFGDDWGNGSSLVSLVNSIDPGLGSNWPALIDCDSGDVCGRVRAALDAAETGLQIPKLFSAEELLSGQVDESSMMLYLSQFFVGQDDAESAGESVRSDSDVIQQFKACSAARRSFAARSSAVHSLVHSLNSMDDGYESQSTDSGNRGPSGEDVAKRAAEQKEDGVSDGSSKKGDRETDIDFYKKYEGQGSVSSFDRDGSKSTDSSDWDKPDGKDDMSSTTTDESKNNDSDDDEQSNDDDDENGDDASSGDADADSSSSSSGGGASHPSQEDTCRELQSLDPDALQQYLTALKQGSQTVYQGRLLLTSPEPTLARSLKDLLLGNSVNTTLNNGGGGILMVDGRKVHQVHKHQRTDLSEQIQVIDANYPADSTFQTSRDVWLVVLDVSQSLDCCCISDTNNTGGLVTPREFLHQCLGCIHSQKKENPGSGDLWNPPVIIVGSNCQQVPGRQQQNFRRELRHFLKGKVYSPHVYDVVMMEGDEAEGDKALRMAIIKLSVSQSQWGRKDPTRWLHLLKRLQVEAEEDWPIMKGEHVAMVAAKSGMKSREEVRSFLEYYHAVQEVIYSEQDSLVVVRPQWLYDVSRKLPVLLETNSRTDSSEWKDFKTAVGLLVKMGILVSWQMQANGQQRFLPPNSLSNAALQLENSPTTTHAPDIFLRFTSADQLFQAEGDAIMPVALYHALVSQCHFTSGWQWKGAAHSDFAGFAVKEISPYSVSLRLLEEAVQVSVHLQDEEGADADILEERLPVVLQCLLSNAKGLLQEHYSNLDCQVNVLCNHVAHKRNRLGKSQGGPMKNYLTRQKLDRQRFLPLRQDDVAFGEAIWCDSHELAVDAAGWKVWFDNSV